MTDNFHQTAERVTKQFYERFRKEHVSFYGFINGIDDHIDEKNKKRKKTDPEHVNTNKQWYVSLLLNRLMFCYFIQQNGFLDNNHNYLRQKLDECKQKTGKNKPHSFYRNFLLLLFHEGLNKPRQKEKIKAAIGKIPYLNGSLFDKHELELRYPIEIDDRAFEQIFDFFDEYEWRLNSAVQAGGRTINPDVIGYIFEKYINDRAQMGAYYTREDITDYISKNCIIPWLFDETARLYPKAFTPDSQIWKNLKQSGEAYIYSAVKNGIKELPGMSRETSKKIKDGSLNHINDFITYNLDIRQFVRDIIINTEDPELLEAFYKSLTKATIIDPTCGSGAFLIAAMNILHPIYQACITRMQAFVDDQGWFENLHNKQFDSSFKFFGNILETLHADHHPNTDYFISKSIIQNNLYGVDMMKEAVEITRFRLFLKLVATIESDYRKPNPGLEPLPGIDFNIRAGNTLVGFATEAQLNFSLGNTLDRAKTGPVMAKKLEEVTKKFARYKEIQHSHGDEFKELKSAKQDLNIRLNALNNDLNRLLHKQVEGLKFDEWLETHQPFHWFVAFYEIVHDRKGFDIIIGNPPYRSAKKLPYSTGMPGFKCSDLFGYIIARCFEILNPHARFGFIVMHNLAFSRTFADARKLIKENTANSWFSFFARIPAGLFSGDVRVRNCIFLLEKNNQVRHRQSNTTRIHRWFSEDRDHLFQKLTYTGFTFEDVIPMFNDTILATLFHNLKGKTLLEYEVKKSKNMLYFKQSAYNWIAVSPEPAPCYKNGKKIDQSQVSGIAFVSEEAKWLSLLLLNGKLFFTYWLTYGDEFHVTRDDLLSIRVPFDAFTSDDKKSLLKLASQFEKQLANTVQYKLNAGKEVGTYNSSRLWHITDKSDSIFLKYWTEKPELITNSIEDHISKTILSGGDEDNRE